MLPRLSGGHLFKRSALLFFVAAAAIAAPGVHMADDSHEKAAAEKLFEGGAYQKAHDAYAAIDQQGLNAQERRWIAFRLADTDWRAASAGRGIDASRQQAAIAALAKILSDATRDEDHDRTWAEVAESLGDAYWLRSDYR